MEQDIELEKLPLKKYVSYVKNNSYIHRQHTGTEWLNKWKNNCPRQKMKKQVLLKLLLLGAGDLSKLTAKDHRHITCLNDVLP